MNAIVGCIIFDIFSPHALLRHTSGSCFVKYLDINKPSFKFIYYKSLSKHVYVCFTKKTNIL